MLVKTALNWVVVIAGALVGVVGLAYFGLQNPSYAIIDRWWFSFIAAAVLFALVPLLGSALAALNKRAWAAVSFLVAVPLFVRWVLLNTDLYLFRWYAWFAGICLLCGLYWLFAWWRKWPAFLRPLPARRRILICAAAMFLLAVLDLAATFVFVVRPYSSTLDCEVPAVFSRSNFGHGAVFTAHPILVGHRTRLPHSWEGTWALARIRERFWSWPLPRVVLLVSPEGGILSSEDYLVDGRRSIGAVTRFLPIVEIQRCCRTRRLPEATLDLRLLRSGFPQRDVRIMGRVDRLVGKTSQELFVPTEYAPVQGAQVEIAGPQGTITTTTDEDGIYDVAGLPPGKYQVRLPTKRGQQAPVALADFPSTMEAGQVAQYSFSYRRPARSD